jgi:hypothetical protein
MELPWHLKNRGAKVANLTGRPNIRLASDHEFLPAVAGI